MAEKFVLEWGVQMTHDVNLDLVAVLTRIDERITELRDLVVELRTLKEWYSTAETAKTLGKAEFTVREWCRLGRIQAEKRPSGRGRSQEWMISLAELTRIRNEGLLPLRKD